MSWSAPFGDVFRAAGLVALLAAGAAQGCTTNHDALARQPRGGSSGGGAGGSSGAAVGGLGNAGNSGNEAHGGRLNPDAEPPGESVLTIVNGAIDASSVRLCFARTTGDGVKSTFVGSPLPELAYGSSIALPSIPELSFADDVIEPWVIAGDLSKIKKLDCAAAVELAQSEEAAVTPDPDEISEASSGGEGAGGAAGEALVMPSLRARSLGAIPAGSLNIGRSILMVMTGCLGGAYYHDKLQASACGSDYDPRTPNLRPVVVTLSRALAFGTVGLQGVHASPATGKLDVRVSGDHGATTLIFASGIGFGKIAPRPADTRFTPAELGVDQPNYGLQIVGESGNVVYQAAWSDIYASSGIETLAPTRTYTAIVLGPDPLLEKRGFWNESKFALVDNDPTHVPSP